MEFFSLRDKVAVITGGGSGIGLAAARRFVHAGAAVVIANRRDCTELAAHMGAEYVRTDVGDEDTVRALMNHVFSRYGRIDVLVNNAGGGEIGQTIDEVSRETLDFNLRTNFLGTTFAIKHAVGHMRAGSSIVNVSSLGGIMGMPTYGAYVASKFAVVGITKASALELAPRGIRVNCICPGTIDTPINQTPQAEAELAAVKTIAALGRIGIPEEVAAAIHFLAAADCGYITGETIVVDGGWAAGPSIALLERLMAIRE